LPEKAEKKGEKVKSCLKNACNFPCKLFWSMLLKKILCIKVVNAK